MKLIEQRNSAKALPQLMKHLFQVFELSKNEQRVVLIVILILITITFIEYERRVDRIPARSASSAELKTSPTPVKTDDER
jgi:hypothetical protein